MALVSFGDLAQSFLLKAQMMRLKSDSSRLSNELASGRLQDVGAALAGDYSRFSALSRAHALSEGYLSAASEAAFHSAAVQTVVGTARAAAGTLTSSLLLATQLEDPSQIGVMANDARGRLDSLLSSMNTSLGGRSLLAGVAVTGPAVADSATILTALQAELVGVTTAEDALTAISDWFDDPAGYAAVGYLGGAALDDVAVSADDQVWMGVTADHSAFRTLMIGLTAATLMTDPTMALPQDEMATLARLSGEALLTAQSALTLLGAEVGLSEARIESASARHEADLLTLEIAQSDLVQGDPYRLATELEAVETGLETVYAVTARLSRLTLADFL